MFPNFAFTWKLRSNFTVLFTRKGGPTRNIKGISPLHMSSGLKFEFCKQRGEVYTAAIGKKNDGIAQCHVGKRFNFADITFNSGEIKKSNIFYRQQL